MADIDEVIISNVGRDGVASEVTLQRLVSALEKTKGIDEKGKKNLKELAAASKTATKNFESFSEEIEKTTTIMEDVGNTLKKAFTLENFGKVLGFAAGTATNFGKEMMKGSVELGDFAQHIPVIGGSLGVFTNILQDGLDTFRSLSDVGAGFGNDLVELRRNAAAAALPLDMFASMISQNADSMRLLGGTTSEGAKRFAQLSKEMRTGAFGERLMNMGFTMEDLNEGLGSYIDLQARLGRAGQMSNQQLVQGSQNYLTELDRLARVTGQSRKALQDEIAAMAQKSNLQALADAIGGEGGENFLAGMAAARKLLPGFGDALEDLADGIPQTELGKKLAALSPAVADAAAAFGRGQISQEEFFDSLKNVGGPQLLEFVDGLDASTRQALLQQEGFGELLGSVHEMRKFVDSNFDGAAAQAEQNRRNKINEGLATFQQRIEEVRQKFMEAFIDSGALDAIGTALVNFGDFLIGAMDGIAEFTKKLADGDILGAVGDLITGSIKTLFENPGTVAAVVGGIAALFAAKSVVGALAGAFKSAISGTVSNVAGKLFSGGGAAPDASPSSRRKGPAVGKGFAKSAGNAGAGVGNFIGQMGAGVMKGAAAGLQAFANPAILVGATILGGAITAIGAGIAGAAWLTGKALPTFVDGIKEFESLDGAAISAAASGMLDLTVAMAAFGAGTAVAGLGTLVGGITEGIGKLFGAEDPLDKVKRFADADIDAAKVKTNAEAMVAFSTAMAAAGGASAAEGLGSLVSGIAGGIGKLFGAEDPLTQLTKFSAQTIDKTIVTNNAEAMAAFSDAMSSVVMMPEKGVFASISGAISGFFGAATPFDQLIAFGALNIESEKVKANAEAMTAFSTAMSGVTMMPEKGIFSSFASALSGLFGGDTPFDQLSEFGALQINAEGVKTNAEAMNSMSVALQGFSSLGEVEINKNLSSRLTALANVPDLTNFATGINSISDISTANINALNSLDNSNVLQYTTAMQKLVEVLGELNDELSKDNNGMFTSGTGTNAGSVVDAIGSSTGSGMSQETADRLNTTLRQVLAVLEESRDYHKDTAKGIKSGDLQRSIG